MIERVKNNSLIRKSIYSLFSRLTVFQLGARPFVTARFVLECGNYESLALESNCTTLLSRNVGTK